MTIEQTVTIPENYQIFLELPRSVPIGVEARVAISIPAGVTGSQNDTTLLPSAEIEDVRRLLHKEMGDKGTAAVAVASGDGWEAHVRERHAEP